MKNESKDNKQNLDLKFRDELKFNTKITYSPDIMTQI